MAGLLEKINKPNDIKKLKPEEYADLAKEIRTFLTERVSRTGGHLASNLGVVELTMALHLFLDFPKDKLIWDVGHQCYVHKVLTGRADKFDTLRQLDGLSGFPRRSESNTDSFDSGHSSVSISEALGMAYARDLKQTKEKIVAVIGDGALTGGLAFEGLNNAGQLKSNMIIVLNDNKMSISENVGSMANYLAKMRTSSKYSNLKGGVTDVLEKIPVVGGGLVRQIRRSKDSLKQLFIPGMFFEELNITYIGPIDGHNIAKIKDALENASRKEGAVLVHVITKKGKGYENAEHNPKQFHGVEAFDPDTGKKLAANAGETYTDVFGKAMVDLAKQYRNMVAITAAMPSGTGLSAFQEKYPSRFFDVGIAEEHAVSFAAGLATGGMHPVVAVYSTFLQRAYDQILHDVCMNRLPVTICVDRAGLVGSDGETHQGIFDLSYLAHIPGLTVMAPKDGTELKQMLEYSVRSAEPIVIRYPRSTVPEERKEWTHTPIEKGKAEWLRENGEVLILAVGSMVEIAEEVADRLNLLRCETDVVNVRFVSPMDVTMLKKAMDYPLVVTMEENVRRGGFGESVAAYLVENSFRGEFMNCAYPDHFIEQGTRAQLMDRYELDTESLVKKISECYEKIRID